MTAPTMAASALTVPVKTVLAMKLCHAVMIIVIIYTLHVSI